MDPRILKIQVTVERQALGYAIRQALRRQRAFYSQESKAYLVFVPDETELAECKLGAQLVLQAMSLTKRHAIV